MLRKQKSTIQLKTRGKPQYLSVKSIALATNIHNSVSVIKQVESRITLTEELMKIHFNKNDFWMNAVTKQYAIIRKDSYLQRKRDVRSLWSAFRPAQTAQQLTAPQVLLSVSPAPETPCTHWGNEEWSTGCDGVQDINYCLYYFESSL